MSGAPISVELNKTVFSLSLLLSLFLCFFVSLFLSFFLSFSPQMLDLFITVRQLDLSLIFVSKA